MKIYMLMEGISDYNVITRLGAFTTKEAAEEAIKVKTEKDPEFKELRVSIIEVELHN